MKSLSKGAWRSIRCLLLIACAGGVLAADNTWVSTVNLGFSQPGSWFASVENPSDLPAVFDFSVHDRSWRDTSMGSVLNSVLFSRTAGSPTQAFSLRSPSGGVASSYEAAFIDQTSRSEFLELRSESASWARGPVSGGASEGPAAITAADGTWRANASGNWSDPTKWGSGVIADGAGHSAAFNTLDITTDVTVTLDSSRTIGSLLIADLNASHHYTINSSGGSTLTFDNAGSDSTLEQMGGSAGDTIAVNLLMKDNLQINNFSANPFTISGNIASSATSNQQFLSFSGNINATGNISDGTTGGNVFVLVSSGTVTFSGTNSYTGGTEIDGGTLLINGVHSGAGNHIYVYGGGTLGGTGTATGPNSNVYAYGGTITGGTSTTVGTLTLQGNLFLDTGEGGGTYLANIIGTTSDLLNITGTLTLGSMFSNSSELIVSGTLDGTTTYTIATFSDLVDDFHFGTTSGIPSNYMLVYHDMDIQLVPIPEPATWIGAGLALSALVFARRKRKNAEKLKS